MALGLGAVDEWEARRKSCGMNVRVRHRESIVRAAAEFDRLGRERFLSQYGFRAATKYLVRIDGRLYDSKAIVGVAYGYENPGHGPLSANEFYGGVKGDGAAAQLDRLGFEIVRV